MKPKTKVIIALVIVLAIFVIGLVAIIVYKINNKPSEEETNTSDTSISEIVPVTEQTTTDTDISTSIEPIISEVDSDRPTIEMTLRNIDYIGLANLSLEQSTKKNSEKMGKLLANELMGADVDYVEILNTSTEDKVLVDVHFKSGAIRNYTLLFETLNEVGFTRCVTTEMYDFIMNGGNLG